MTDNTATLGAEWLDDDEMAASKIANMQKHANQHTTNGHAPVPQAEEAAQIRPTAVILEFPKRKG